ncbi:MAG: hypothetical protein ACREQ5_00760 [Candidatus Dormibacteria bacterium]
MTMPTFTDGVLVHAASLTSLSAGVNSINSLLTGAVAPRLYVPTATATITSNTSIGNATDTIITFDAAGVNNDTMWAAAVNHFTIKTAGVYLAWAQCQFAAAAGGIRAAYILLNGTSVVTNAVAAGFRNPQSFGDGNYFTVVTPPLSLAVNATLYFSVFQSSGAALNMTTTSSGAFMGLVRIGS